MVILTKLQIEALKHIQQLKIILTPPLSGAASPSPEPKT
jgi:hypothetical protein